MRNIWSTLRRAGHLPQLAILTLFGLSCPAANINIWDTQKALAAGISTAPRAEWKLVPDDLLDLEANPAKAKSDPGYYGREYTALGDIVVENSRVTAQFSTHQGRVLLYSKGNGPSNPLAEFAALAPAASDSSAPALKQVRILRHADDEAIVEAVFQENNKTEKSITFSFDGSAIVGVKAASEAKSVQIFAPLAYAIAPSFIADDLVIAPRAYAGSKTLSVPCENILLGLLPGEQTSITMTWPQGRQHLELQLSSAADAPRLFNSIEFAPDDKPFFLAAQSASGLWRREELRPAYLEKDVPSEWQRPFAAKWKTELIEGRVRTTFAFRDKAQEIWRGVEGSYPYPVWFDGQRAMFHFSKKIPPKNEAVIYFTEGRDTPDGIQTPIDILKTTLGRAYCDELTDPVGRSLSTHHRRGGEGVHRACTCGCTEAIEAVFQTGQEVTKKDYVREAVDDMIYFIQRHISRIEEYQHFADEMTAFLQSRATASPDLKPYTDDLIEIAGRIKQEYSVQKENMKSLEHAGELSRRTLALTVHSDPENRKAYGKLLEEWRGMGGAQDYVLAQCHVITRQLYQEAGYESLTRPETLDLAREIRNRCRRALRNPDGYEIWPDY